MVKQNIYFCILQSIGGITLNDYLSDEANSKNSFTLTVAQIMQIASDSITILNTASNPLLEYKSALSHHKLAQEFPEHMGLFTANNIYFLYDISLVPGVGNSYTSGFSIRIHYTILKINWKLYSIL